MLQGYNLTNSCAVRYCMQAAVNLKNRYTLQLLYLIRTQRLLWQGIDVVEELMGLNAAFS